MELRTPQRIDDLLSAAALGDAIGTAYAARKQRAAFLRRATSGDWRPSKVSWRTVVLLFTTEGLIRSQQRAFERFWSPENVIPQALHRWMRTQLHRPAVHDSFRGALVQDPRMRKKRSPPAGFFEPELEHADRYSPEHPINDEPSAVPLLHANAIGAVMEGAPAVQLARQLAAMSYGHVDTQLASALLAVWVAELLKGGGERAFGRALVALASLPGTARLLARLEHPLEERHPAVQALGLAHRALTREPDALLPAVVSVLPDALDAPVAAMVTAALLAARAHDLPRDAFADLELGDLIARLAADLHRSFVLQEELDYEEYPPC